MLQQVLTKIIQHKNASALFITTIIAIIYYHLGINSWQFSFVGDEWPFYEFAKKIADANMLVNPFNMQGVYLQNPVLASIYQALFLKILGYSNVAWRLSNILLIIPITFFFFLWIKKLFDSQTAFISTIILQSSFYIANFFKIGNIMPQSLTLFIIALYATTSYALSYQRRYIFFLAFTLGLSFYIYIGPLFPFILSGYLFTLAYKRAHLKRIIYDFILLSVFYLGMVSPGLFDMLHWQAAMEKTVFKKEFTDNIQIIKNIFHNFLLFYKNYDYLYNHFVVGPYLDPVSRFFAFIGTIIVLKRIKNRVYLALFIAYLSTTIIIGFTSPYPYAPTTRGLFFLPFGFLFAAIGLRFITQRLKLFYISYPIFIGIFFFNLHQSQFGVFQETGYSGTALVLKELQENNKRERIFLVLSETNSYNYKNLYIMKEAYGLQATQFSIIRSPRLDCNTIANGRVLVFNTDQEAIKKIIDFPCASQYSVKKLTPAIHL